MKRIGLTASDEMSFENVDRRRIPSYTISSPMSLRSGELISNDMGLIQSESLGILLEAVTSDLNDLPKRIPRACATPGVRTILKVMLVLTVSSTLSQVLF